MATSVAEGLVKEGVEHYKRDDCMFPVWLCEEHGRGKALYPLRLIERARQGLCTLCCYESYRIQYSPRLSDPELEVLYNLEHWQYNKGYWVDKLAFAQVAELGPWARTPADCFVIFAKLVKKRIADSNRERIKFDPVHKLDPTNKTPARV